MPPNTLGISHHPAKRRRSDATDTDGQFDASDGPPTTDVDTANDAHNHSTADDAE